MKKIYFAVILLTFFAVSCNNTFNMGENVLPGGDLLEMQMTDTVEVFMYTEVAPRMRTDKPQFLFVGGYDDPVFGHTNSDFITQVLQGQYPIFPENPILDSICLVLPLVFDEKDVYGKNPDGFSMNLSVYEVKKLLSTTDEYYPDEDPADYTNNYETLLGSGDAYLLRSSAISGATATSDDTSMIVLRLNDEFGELLLNNSDNYFFTSGKFTEVFKGIYVKNNTPNSGVYKLFNSVPGISTNFGIVMFYHSEQGGNQHFGLPINRSGAQFNLFDHDYSSAVFSEQLNNPGTVVDSLAYLQSMGGTVVRLEMPGLKNFDSIVVNKAELLIKNSQTDSNYAAIDEIWFAGYDTAQAIVYFNDFSGDKYIGAPLREGEGYNFFLTRIVQNLIENKYANYNMGIYLTDLHSGLDFKRSVLKTGQNSTPTKLIITYTKY